MSVPGLRTIQSELESAKKWADMLEYAPELLLSSIDKKLSAGSPEQNILPLISYLQWTENCIIHFEAAKTGLISNKKIEPDKKQNFHSKFESIRSQVNSRLGILEKDYPFLHAHLKSKFNFEVFSSSLEFVQTPQQNSSQKNEDSQQSKLI